MIWIVARKELREIVRDGRFRVAGVVVLALSLAALAAGWRHYATVSAEHDEARRSTREQWLNQPEKNPHSAAHYGVYAFKPRSQLSMVDTGIDPYVGVAAWLEAHKQNEFRYRPAQDRTSIQRFGELTAAEILQSLLPLFIILLAFPAFAGEREAGTLRQVLSLGVARRSLLAGKALGVAAAMALVLVPATAAGVAVVALITDGGVLAGSLPKSMLLMAAYLLYFLVFVGLSLAASAWFQSSRLALVALLAFWMVNALVAPRLLSDAAGTVHRLPSAVEFRTAVDRDLTDTREVEERIAARRAELLREHNAESLDAVPIGFSGISLQEGEEYANTVFDRHYGRLFDTYERQNALVRLGGALAPLLSIQSISMGLAGTDLDHHRQFVHAAEHYRREMQRMLNADIATHQRPGQVYLAGAELWSRVPAFDYVAPSTRWVLRRQATSLAVLCGWAMLALVLAVFAVRSTRVL